MPHENAPDAHHALASLRAAPDKSASYRRFADAIAASDPERAQIIRIAMHEQEGLRVGLTGLRGPLPEQAVQKLRVLQRQFRERLPPSVREIATIDHGFVDGIRVESGVFVREQEGIAAAFAELVERGLSLHGLENLTFRPLSEETAEIVASVPLLQGVRCLDLGRRVSIPAVRAIAGSPHLGALDTLMARPVDGDAGASALAEGTGIRALERLHLSQCAMGDEGARRIAAWQAAATLRWIDLFTNRIGPAGAAHLATLPRVEDLDLGMNPIGDDGGTAIVSGPMGGTLREAYLNDTGIGLRTLTALGQAPCAGQLRHLYIGGNGLADVIRAAPPMRFPGLVSLDVSGADLDARALQAVLKWIEPKAGSPDAGSADAGSPSESPLRVLFLSNNRLTDIDAASLVGRAWLKPRLLDVTYNDGISAHGRAALLRRFGKAVEIVNAA